MAKISTIYTIRNSKDEIVTTIDSGTRDTSTSLILHGKGAPEYGLDRDQNLVYLLENFSNTTAPANPIVGQLWWKTGDEMFVFDDSGSPSAWASVVPPPLGLGFDVVAGAGLTGGGFPTLSPLGVIINVGAGTGIQLDVGSPLGVRTKDSEIVHDNLSGFDANEHIDHSAVIITAGDGLSGGGDLTASRTFDVDVADFGGLFAYGSPPSLSIGGNVEGTGVPQGSPSNVVRTSGDQQIAGIKTFRDQILAGSSAPGVVLPPLSELSFDSIASFPSAVVGLAWTEDGTKLSYNFGSGTFFTYTATTPWSLSGLSLTDTSVFDSNRASWGHTWHPDGTKFYTCSIEGDVFSQWDVPTPNDISSIVDKNTPEATVSQFECKDMQWVQNGAILAGLWDKNDGWLVFFDCSIPYDLSTAVKRAGERRFFSMGGTSWVDGIACSDDGLRVYACNRSAEKIHQADLGTAFLATSGVINTDNDLTLNPGNIRPTNLFVSPNENSLYVGRGQGKKIERYTWTDTANSATNPTYTFKGNTNTGWYIVDADGALAFTTDGTERFRVEADGTLSASTASYTSLVVDDDDIPNKEYVDDQAASGTSPTSNIFTGTSTLTGLDATKTYLVSIYGVVNFKGTLGNATIDAIRIRSGTSLGNGTVLAGTSPSYIINWPDGDFPIHNVFVVDMTRSAEPPDGVGSPAGPFTSLNCQINDSSTGGINQYSTQIRAMQLN